jgi:hypothetical protein
MKKFLKISVVFMIMLACSVCVAKATTSDDLYAYLSQTFTVNGQSVTIDAENLNKAKRYLNQYPVTEAQAEEVKAQVQGTIAIMNEAKVSDYKKLSAAQKEQVKSKIVAAGNAVGAKIVFSSNSNGKTTADIYSPDGILFDSVTVSGSDGLVQTGSDYSFVVYAIAGVAVVAVAAVVISKKNKVNA